jgi:uncharacterized caspase-like protein
MACRRASGLGRGCVVVAGLMAAAGGVRADGNAGAAGENYAVLIGVRQYGDNELRPLPYSEADVVRLAQVFQESGYRPENVVLMTQTRGAENHRFLPLADNIRTELKRVLRKRNRSDQVVIAFAGHGIQFRDGPENYFCSMDARLSARGTLIARSEVYRPSNGCSTPLN